MRARALSAEDAAASAEARVQTLQEDIQMLEQTVGEGRRMLHHKLAGVSICASSCMLACMHARTLASMLTHVHHIHSCT